MMENNNLTSEENDFSGLIKRIKFLQEVKPNENWVTFCRADLTMKIRIEHKKEMLSKDFFALREIFSFLRQNNYSSIFAKLSYAVSLTLILLLAGAGLTAWAASKSLPGSPLYKVKIAMEEARLMIVSQENKNKLQSEMADKRLEELKTVINGSGSPQAKEDGVEEVVNNLQQQLINDKDQLPTTNKGGNNQNNNNAIAAAKDVVDRAKQVKEALVEAKDSLPADIKANLGDKLSEAVDVADQTSLQALEVMVDKPDKTDADKNEISSRFNEIIKDNEDAIDSIDAKNLSPQATSTADKFPINAVLVNQSDQARELLGEVKDSLVANDFSAALDNLKALNDIVKGAQSIAEDSNLQEDSTSTPPVNPENENSSTSTQPSPSKSQE